MSVCPHCGRHTDTEVCPYCQGSRDMSSSESVAQGNTVIEPEIVSDDFRNGRNSGQNCSHNADGLIGQGQGKSCGQGCGQGYGQGYGQAGRADSFGSQSAQSEGRRYVRFTSWTNAARGSYGNSGQQGQGGAYGFSANNRDACLPGIVTLVIALVISMNFGILAGIGFLVFYAVLSALAFTMTVQRAMRGQYTPVWVRRVLVWCVSAAITVGLAGGF